MQFNSLAFGAFLALALAAFYLTPRAWRWLSLLAASYAFFGLSDLLHLWVLPALTAVAYVSALWIRKADSPAKRRRLLWAGLLPLFVALVAFRWLSVSFPGSAALAIPLGLSFVTLRLASYLVDVSRGTIAAESHPGVFAAHAALFHELPAGPIERVGSLLPQLRLPSPLEDQAVADGAKLFAWGLFKKLVIADRLRVFVDYAYGGRAGDDGAAYLVATVFFAVQIYCDFSGYSDMAIGLGEVFGLRLAKNFDRPYRSRSITEFWSRWHMSLSFWLRDYVFLPLVYSTGRALDGRVMTERAADLLGYAVAASLTMALCGLWHGFTWTYLAWGLLMALFMVASVATRQARSRLAKKWIGRRWRGAHQAARVALTFALVCVSWVFFRASSIGAALHVLGSFPRGLVSYGAKLGSNPAGTGFWAALVAPFRLGQNGFGILVAFAVIALLVGVEVAQGQGSIRARVRKLPVWVRFPLYAALILSIVVFRAQAASNFIYAGF